MVAFFQITKALNEGLRAQFATSSKQMIDWCLSLRESDKQTSKRTTRSSFSIVRKRANVIVRI
jgi:hypothetical protein